MPTKNESTTGNKNKTATGISEAIQDTFSGSARFACGVSQAVNPLPPHAAQSNVP
jgi:hypothetical protein